jgi:membrane protease YdiL (CAAX protease family)
MAAPTRIVTRVVQAHPMLVFAFLACLFGWGIYIAAFFGLGSNPDNMPLGPLFAALIVASFQGRVALRSWGRSLRNWRASPKAYLLVVLAPALLHVINVLINHGLGAPLPTLAQLSHWPEIPVTFVVMLVMVGIGEEAGWTAFALPLMLRKHGVLGAWAAVSAVRILWHLPLMLNGEMPWVMGIVGNAAFTMVALQVLTLSGGRWSLVAVWHSTLNAFGGAFFFAMVTGNDKDNLALLLAGGYAVVGAAMYFAGGQHRTLPELQEGPAQLEAVEKTPQLT